MYTTLYHAIPHQKAKYWLKKLDHCAIYLLIAGTYTPFLLVGLNSPLAKGMMAVIWGLAGAALLRAGVGAWGRVPLALRLVGGVLEEDFPTFLTIAAYTQYLVAVPEAVAA